MDVSPATDAARVASTSASVSCAASGPSACRAGKILLAEGNRLNQKIAVRILQSAGHEVTVVATGGQALGALLQSAYDLILMDTEMPEMNGFEATRTIREHETATSGHIQIVAMISSKAQADLCRQAGMDQHITKPLNADEVRRVVASALGPADADSAFNEADALSRLRGDGAFLRTLASMFLEDSPSLIEDIRAAVEQQDGRRLARAAHTLKGSAYPFCARGVSEAAQALESLGESGQMANALVEYGRFEPAINRLLTALTALTLREDGERSSSPNAAVALEDVLPCIA